MASKAKIIRNKEQVDLTGYVNPDTGEVLPVGTTVVRESPSDKVTISSDNYSVIDVDVIKYLSTVLGKADLGRILYMSTMTATPLNFLVSGNKALHSPTTLKESLEIKSKSTFFGFIKRLKKLGVLYSMNGKFGNRVRTVYLLNPFLSRRRKTFDKQVLEVFKDSLKIEK